MTTETRRAWLSLGSNLGDRAAMIAGAIERLRTWPGVEVEAVSSLHETAPWGDVDQGAFLNAAAEIRTSIGPHALLDAVKEIEADLGRTASRRWGPRAIDIDIVHMEGIALVDERLTLPHRYWRERDFVLVPLAEIAPDLVIGGMPVTSALATSDTMGITRVERLSNDDIAAELARRQLWTRDGDAIARTITFKGFMRPLLLANAIGHLADQMNHHPELTIRWGELTIRLWTHDAGGLTERDFDLAGRIDMIAGPAAL